MSGQDLFEAIIQNTGLPDDFIRPRFEALILSKNLKLENLELEEVRVILADLLIDLINSPENQG